MSKGKLLAVIPGILALIVGVFFITFLIIKWLWAWTIPDLFPGAVETGLIAKEISWFTSFKLAIFLTVITGIVKSNNTK
tara:strand:- start:94 stop:330 length:237 start_codon:yes stop_codon:yes gene_type:complete